MKYYHNPRCRKSRAGLELLNSKGIHKIEIIDYIKNPLTVEELSDTLNKLKINPLDLIRKNESVFKELFKGKSLKNKDWIKAMIEYPKLMERPIFITKNKAIIGRPPEKVLELIDEK